jgi:hypothetical protein
MIHGHDHAWHGSKLWLTAVVDDESTAITALSADTDL